VAPAAVLRHFLEQCRRAEAAGGLPRVAGFPALGLQICALESGALRQSLGLGERQGGRAGGAAEAAGLQRRACCGAAGVGWACLPACLPAWRE
jgi:hypothetical protein